MFRVGERVRINEGRFYGAIGVVLAVRDSVIGTTYTVRHAHGTADVSYVLSTFANNGD
jgi:transcription antitermination factor NusG